VPPVALTVPPPRSVALAAELALLVEMLTLVSCNVPPPLVIAPWGVVTGRLDPSMVDRGWRAGAIGGNTRWRPRRW
jgi:hypothetical protein